MTDRQGNRTMNRLVLLAAAGVVTAAVVKELRRPAQERTWQGRILGLPYDFRPPTPARVLAEFWDPDNDALFTPHAFGVGYGVNLARLARPLLPPLD
ncbi:hypothetical protein ABH931_007502 [Streptacidiphilus sp. MAP12-33]|uniref:DUF5808 domain-containing protein n=1 Tax=Streptacidiphilus sp. MAP12-33 TaxID=3156266 RepID=UPI003513B92D